MLHAYAESHGFGLQAFLFPQFNDDNNLWRVSYERLGADDVDEAKGLAKVIDTETYYQGLTADGTTSGALATSFHECSYGLFMTPGVLMRPGGCPK